MLSICTVTGKAVLSGLDGTEPVVATLMMHGWVIVRESVHRCEAIGPGSSCAPAGAGPGSCQSTAQRWRSSGVTIDSTACSSSWSATSKMLTLEYCPATCPRERVRPSPSLGRTRRRYGAGVGGDASEPVAPQAGLIVHRKHRRQTADRLPAVYYLRRMPGRLRATPSYCLSDCRTVSILGSEAPASRLRSSRFRVDFYPPEARKDPHSQRTSQSRVTV